MGSIPGQGTKILHATWHDQRSKVKGNPQSQELQNFLNNIASPIHIESIKLLGRRPTANAQQLKHLLLFGQDVSAHYITVPPGPMGCMCF